MKQKRKSKRTTYKEWITEEGLLKIEAWARDGLTNDQIAENIGIARGTLYTWKNEYSDFNDALKRGKEVIDIQVENALFKNATGYDYIEEVSAVKKTVYYNNGKREKEVVEPVTLELKRHKTPETAAMIFWLKNRKPKEWRDKREYTESNTANKLHNLMILNNKNAN